MKACLRLTFHYQPHNTTGLPPQCYHDCPPMHFPSIRALISHPDERHVQVRIAVKYVTM